MYAIHPICTSSEQCGLLVRNSLLSCHVLGDTEAQKGIGVALNCAYKKYLNSSKTKQRLLLYDLFKCQP